MYRLSYVVFPFTRLRNASLVFGTEVPRAGKRFCFRKVEYPPSNVFNFMPPGSLLLVKMKLLLLVLVFRRAGLAVSRMCMSFVVARLQP